MDSKVDKVSCFGNVTSKHPLVYLVLPKDGFVICPYCAKKFEYSKIHQENKQESK